MILKSFFFLYKMVLLLLCSDWKAGDKQNLYVYWRHGGWKMMDFFFFTLLGHCTPKNPISGMLTIVSFYKKCFQFHMANFLYYVLLLNITKLKGPFPRTCLSSTPVDCILNLLFLLLPLIILLSRMTVFLYRSSVLKLFCLF